MDAKIVINIVADNKNPLISFTGEEIQKVTHRDMRNLFFIDRETIEEYTSAYFNNTKPRKVLYSAERKRKPLSDVETEDNQDFEDTSDVNQISGKNEETETSTSDLYKRFNWKPVTLTTTIKRMRIKDAKEVKSLYFSKTLVNPTNDTLKVNAGLQMPVAITLETNWHTEPVDVVLDYDFVYDINVNLNEDSGTTDIKHTTTFGTPTRQHELVNIGRKNYEVDLEPGQVVTANFSAKVCNLAIKVTVLTTVSGNLAVNFKEALNERHWWGPEIKDVLNKANYSTESPIEEYLGIKLDFFYDVKVEVFDKKTGKQL